jgi:hypothetical protein
MIDPAVIDPLTRYFVSAVQLFFPLLLVAPHLQDTVLIRLGTCVNLLLDRIALLPDARNVNIAFPDDGAAKRFGDMFPQYPQRIICHKVRGEGDKRVVKLKEGDVQGRHCIIGQKKQMRMGTTSSRSQRVMVRSGY